MSNSSDIRSNREFQSLPGLETFIERLEPGMEIEGRVVEVLNDNIFILRVWGNNILAESNHAFQKFEEVILSVRSVKPKLVFHMRPKGYARGNAIYA